MNDMVKVTEPRSDQYNYDDFQAGPITFKITAVKVTAGQDQPVEISLDGSTKFYRPCKSMARVMVAAWGADSSKYIGKSLTLYGDPTIKWGGMCVGGIRISHMSDIADTMTMALTVTRANKKPFIVQPLVNQAFDYDAALDTMRGAVSWAQVVSAYAPAAKRASADKDKPTYDILTNAKNELKSKFAANANDAPKETKTGAVI